MQVQTWPTTKYFCMECWFRYFFKHFDGERTCSPSYGMFLITNWISARKVVLILMKLMWDKVATINLIESKYTMLLLIPHILLIMKICSIIGFCIYSQLIFLLQRNTFDNYLPSFAGSYLYANVFSDSEKKENLIEGWDLVEHPTFPPPPSQTEDVEHWTRAMFIDATKKWYDFPPPDLVRITSSIKVHKFCYIWFIVFQWFWIFK